MASNIAVKITADVASLQSQLAIARAEFQQTQRAMNDLARQAATTGLNDKLKSDLQQAAANMLQAKQRTNELASELKRLSPAAHESGQYMAFLGESARALGFALSIEKVVEFTRGVFEMAAGLQRQANVLNISTDQLQAFQYAARNSGIDVEGAQAALQKFYVGVGQAAEGTGPARQALLDLGLDIGKLAVDQQHSSEIVARALLNESNEFERAAHIRALYGRGGADINAMLAELAHGHDENLAAAKRNGEYLGGEQVEAAHRSEVAFEHATTQLKVSATPAVVDFTEKLAGVVGWLAKANDGVKEFIHHFDIKVPADSIFAKLPGYTAPEKPPEEKGGAKPDKPKLTAEQVDVAGLAALDSKLRERKTLTAEIAQAQRTLAEAQKAGDAAGVTSAKTVISDLNKQLQSLNKVDYGGGFKDAGAEAIAKARETISEINADQTKGNAERRAAIDDTYKQLLNSAKLNKAQHIQIETDRNNAIAAADKQGANEKRQVDQATAQNEQRIAQVGFDAKRSAIEEEVTAGNLTRQQGFAQLLALTDEETAARLKAVKQAEQGYATDTTFFIQKELEKKLIVAESEAQKAAIRRQAEQASATESAQIWKRSMSEIESVENTFESQLLSGRVGVLGAMEAAGAQFVQEEIKQTIKGLTERLLLSKSELAADQSLGQLGVLSHWLFEGQKTAATAAGETARVTEKEAARSAGSAADVAAGSATILNDAYKSAAGAYSAVVGIPIVGPILAPIAAGTAFAAVAAFDTLTSLDTGTNYVPRDMPAMIHAGERVVPAADNSAMVAALQGGAANGNGGQVQFHYHAPAGRQTDHAQDAKDMVRTFNHARRTGALKLK